MFSLLAKVRARSYGILFLVSIVSPLQCTILGERWSINISSCLPNALQMHWTDLDNMLLLLRFQDAISSASGHASNVKKFRPVDHMIICF